MNKNKVVVAVCGPAHSGKSVFLNQLYNILPTNRTFLIRGCPDGEGLWSNAKNQHEIQLSRKKGQFSRSFVNEAVRDIAKSKSDIVLVDVGGFQSEENVKIMSCCDYYVIVSSDKAKALEWEKFVESFISGWDVPTQKPVKKEGELAVIKRDISYTNIIHDMLIENMRYVDLEPKKPKLLAKFDSVLGKYEDEYVADENGIDFISGKVKNLTRGNDDESLAACYLANRLLREVRHDRIDVAKEVDSVSVQLQGNEELLNEATKKNAINMNILREYIDVYMRMFVRKEKKGINILQRGDNRLDIRNAQKRKHQKIIEERVRFARQKFLLEVKEKGAVKKDVIDMSKVADFFGMIDKNGSINWDTEKLPEVMFLMEILMKDMKKVHIYGYIPNWMAAAIGEKGKNRDLSLYRKNNEIFEIAEERQKNYNLYTRSFNILENDESVLLHWNGVEKDAQVYLPKISEDKRLYISGRMSTRMTAAIAKSYKNPEKSVNIPGVGFVKCASEDFKTLGKIERQPKGIDYIEYLEDQVEGR